MYIIWRMIWYLAFGNDFCDMHLKYMYLCICKILNYVAYEKFSEVYGIDHEIFN